MGLRIELSNIEDGNYYVSYSLFRNLVVDGEKFIDGGGAMASSVNRLREVCRDICYKHSLDYIEIINSEKSSIKKWLFEELQGRVANFKRL